MTRSSRLALPVVIFAVGLALTGRTPAAGPLIDRVEEDWELVVGDPSTSEVGPQITTTMSPDGSNDKSFVAFNLNYRDVPFRAGGLQVIAYVGGAQTGSGNSQQTAQLATDGETVTWTQRMVLGLGYVQYDILSSSSTTWPNFGQGGNLRINFNRSLTDFSAYNPDVSVENSGAGWQPDRVTSMRLVRVRYYSGGALVSTDTTSRSVSLSD